MSRRDPQSLPLEVLRPVMSADVSKLPAYLGLPVGDAGYMLVRVSKVLEGDPKQAGDPLPRAAALSGTAQYEAYVASLRKQRRHLGQPDESGEEVASIPAHDRG